MKNIKDYLKWLPLLGILLFFLGTRLYQIDQIPPSLYWDEASIGYNAYSVLETGKDEWGKFLPLHFRAFGEFKLPVYIYTVAIFERFLGLSDFAVRLPSVIFSLTVILLAYLIALKIFTEKISAFFTALFITITPWFFIFSRTGYEASAGLMLFMLGLYLFLYIGSRPFFLVPSVLGFILSAYSYNSFIIIVPLTLIFLIISQYNSLIYHLKKFIIFKLVLLGLLILLFLSAIPIVRLMRSDNVTTRFQTIGLSTENKKKLVIQFIGNYLSHFNPDFLFINGDKNLRSQIGVGQIFWLDFPLILLGLFYIFRRNKLLFYLPVFLALISFIPAAITRESPHALRSISVVPFFAIISALGVWYLTKLFKKKYLIFISVGVIYLVLFGNYFYNFIYDYPQKSSQNWQYGYKQIFTSYNLEFNIYDKVLISEQEAQPYIFALYYLKYDPTKFRKEVRYNSPDKWGFSAVNNFSNFIFRPINLTNLPKGKLLIFASPKEKLSQVAEKAVIKNLDNQIAFYVYEYTQ